MWRMTSGARWVQFDDDPVRVTASQPALAGIVSDPAAVEVAAMTGVFHTPAGPGPDSLAVFLRARQILGAPATVTGRPPRVPTAGGGAGGGDVVF